MSLIEVVTGVVRDADGRLLLVRKRGTQRFMLPGGKGEPGETPIQTLARELFEELGCRLASAEPFGVFEAVAANEPDHRVRGHVHLATIDGAVTPTAEIEEIRWIDPHAPDVPLAPLLETQILPRLTA